MRENAISFQFPDRHSAYAAFDTLEELGYEPKIREESGNCCVDFEVERNDITSALQIAQSHGGKLLETKDYPTELSAYNSAYGMDEIRIPAHTVNEDWPEHYATAGSDADENGVFDPGGDSYDHFEPGIRL
ncbi:hypothetical protein [Paenibacillus turpanensis]|uniref:hypothetical protein n=1 Tax=Paenibacillus turpanensis TaxID=2689078 RepID=UPI00140A1DBF|nr:hypothetical protein [Paenibacillus turpanensis]